MDRTKIVELLIRVSRIKEECEKLRDLGCELNSIQVGISATAARDAADALEFELLHDAGSIAMPGFVLTAGGKEAAVISDSGDVLAPRGDLVARHGRLGGSDTSYIYLHDVFRLPCGSGPFAGLLLPVGRGFLLILADEPPRKTLLLPIQFGPMLKNHPLYSLMALEPGRRVVPVLRLEGHGIAALGTQTSKEPALS